MIPEETITKFTNTEESIENMKKYFKRRGITYDEDSLLNVILNSKSKNELFYAIIALRDIGTEKAIPILKKSAFYKNQDAQSNSLLTISQIAREKETKFYGDCLLDKNYRLKAYALWALVASSNNKAVPQVIEFLNNRLKSGNDGSLCIPACIVYLNRYFNENEKINMAFLKLKNKWNILSKNAQDNLKESIDYFKRNSFI